MDFSRPSYYATRQTAVAARPPSPPSDSDSSTTCSFAKQSVPSNNTPAVMANSNSILLAKPVQQQQPHPQSLSKMSLLLASPPTTSPVPCSKPSNGNANGNCITFSEGPRPSRCVLGGAFDKARAYMHTPPPSLCASFESEDDEDEDFYDEEDDEEDEYMEDEDEEEMRDEYRDEGVFMSD